MKDRWVKWNRTDTADTGAGVDYSAITLGKVKATNTKAGYVRQCFVQVTCPICNRARKKPLSTVRFFVRRGTWSPLCKDCAFATTAKHGGRHIMPTGYVRLSQFAIPLGQRDFFAICRKSAAGHVMEHRWVMALHLERPLDSHEVVHHINGKRDDNRLENLRLFTEKQHHAGHDDHYDECVKLRAEVARLSRMLHKQQHPSVTSGTGAEQDV